jgi:heterodisulfide reductase subunit A
MGEQRVSGVECQRVADFRFDENGRLHVNPLPGSTHVLPADTVIFAVGQAVALNLCKEARQTDRRTLAVDPETWMTSEKGIFAAGDAVSGTSSAIQAIASGHRAAFNIHRFLHPEPDNGHSVEPWRTLTEIELPAVRYQAADLALLPRQTVPNRGPASLDEPLSERQALAEAARCLNCGTCAECLQCQAACEAGAIDHNQQPWQETVEVGAVVVATGFDVYDPRRKPELGYGKYPNVLHALEVERLLSASGPTAGAVRLPDGRAPQNVVFIQCVGSRDRQNGANPYCSRVCCMYTAKEAHLLRERLPEAEITVFYTDIRAFGKGFEAFHERVRGERVRYRRGAVSEVLRGPGGRLIVRAEDTLQGRPLELESDLVVLATALVPRADSASLAEDLSLRLGPDGFFLEAEPLLAAVDSGVPGIYLAGACQGPKDILDSVSHAKAAAASALIDLARAEMEYGPLEG